MKDTTGQIDVLDGVTSDYFDARNPNLLDRWQPMTDWVTARLDARLDPYCKSTSARIGPRTCGYDRAGRRLDGINFASQDYLSLSSHPDVIAAATNAAQQFGVHSAGSAALMGLTAPTLDLEARIAGFLKTADATVFPTGWGAGYGAIRALVRPGDHILIDVLAHACLQEAADAATANVHRFPHCSTDAVERRLTRLRKEHPDAGILIVSEGVFSMDSDIPDLVALQAMAKQYGATLFVDVAHDLGALGPSGRGVIETQAMLGKIDIVMGSFSKTFASNGGFVATDHPALKLALRFGSGPQTFSNALSPVQAAAVLAALDVVDSPEGTMRRGQLMSNVLRLRGALSAAGFDLLGQPSAIVPARIGANAMARRMTAATLAAGGIVNLVEYPAVAKNACRWRLQVMADHSPEDIDQFVAIAVAARAGSSDAAGQDHPAGQSVA